MSDDSKKQDDGVTQFGLLPPSLPVAMSQATEQPKPVAQQASGTNQQASTNKGK